MPHALPDALDWPLVPGHCQALDEDEVAQFRACLRHHLLGSGLDLSPGSADAIHTLRCLPLSFYPGFMLVTGEVPLPNRRVGSLDVLIGPGLFSVLEGTRSLIQALNAGRLPAPQPPEGETQVQSRSIGRRAARHAAPCYPSPLLTLTSHREAAADYLRFFCAAVRGPMGSFRVLETDAQLRQCQVSNAAEWASRLQPLILAPHRDESGRHADGLFSGRVLMLYGGDLHETQLCVHEGGLVAMLSDDVLGQDLAPVESLQGPLRNVRPAPQGSVSREEHDPSTPAGKKP